MNDSRLIDTPEAAWSFNGVGPFHALQRRLGLLSDTDPAAGRRALLFALLAWLPALGLAWAQGYALNEQHPRALLFDFSAYAFVIAIAAFVLMEKTSDQRMAALVNSFGARGLVTASARPGFARARLAMERRTGLWWVEAALLGLAYWLGHAWLLRVAAGVEGGTWFGQAGAGALQPTLAGWWALLVTLPLFLFLLGRWLWRFVTWGLLLRDIAGCELRLVATHPDRCGGLAFIGQYPKTYMLFVFALSTVVSAGVLKQVVYGGASLLNFKFAAFGMAAFLLLAFVVPLLAFAPVLRRLKLRGLALYGALISRHNLAFEAKWGGAPAGDDALGSADMSSLADLSASYDLVRNIQSIPVTKESIVPLLVAMVVPMAAVAATQVPVAKVLAAVKGVLLI